MPKTVKTSALGLGSLLLLAACGGQPDDAPPRQEPATPISGTAANRVPAVTLSAPSATAPLRVAASAPRAGDRMTSMQQQITLLHREVAEIRQQLARRPDSAPQAEAQPNPRTDPNAQLEAERVEQQRIASTEAAFRNEREDAAWSRDTLATLHAALAEADAALRDQVGSVECRSQSCRVVIGSGEAGGSAGQDIPLVMSRLAATLPKVTAGQIDQGNGRVATVLYLSR